MNALLKRWQELCPEEIGVNEQIIALKKSGHQFMHKDIELWHGEIQAEIQEAIQARQWDWDIRTMWTHNDEQRIEANVYAPKFQDRKQYTDRSPIPYKALLLCYLAALANQRKPCDCCEGTGWVTEMDS